MNQICTFLLDGRTFGVPVADVQEVLRPQRPSRVPLAPPGVTGLMNLRGQIVPTIDLRPRLGLPPRGRDAQPLNLVVRAADGLKALLVDDVGEVIEADAAAFEPTADLLRGPAGELIRGAYPLGGQLVLVLDVAKAVRGGTS
jgi:purine-binding chemotaxis protein CheW